LRFKDELQLVDEGSNTLFIFDPTGERCRQTFRFAGGLFGGSMQDAIYRQLRDGTTVIISTDGEAIWTKNCNTTARMAFGGKSGQNREVSAVFPDGSLIINSYLQPGWNLRPGWRWVRDGVLLADFNFSGGMGIVPIYVGNDTVFMHDPDAVDRLGMAWIRLR